MTGGGAATVPIFMLVPQVQLPKRLDLGRDAARAHAVPGLVVSEKRCGKTVTTSSRSTPSSGKSLTPESAALHFSMRGNLGLFVSSADRARLAAIIADRNGPQKHAWRAEVVLLTGDRVGTAEIMRRTELGKVSVWRWQDRYIDDGIDGLLRDKTRPSRIPKLADEKVAEVIRRTQEEAPPDGGTHHAGSWGPRSPTRWTVRATRNRKFRHSIGRSPACR